MKLYVFFKHNILFSNRDIWWLENDRKQNNSIVLMKPYWFANMAFSIVINCHLLKVCNKFKTNQCHDNYQFKYLHYVLNFSSSQFIYYISLLFVQLHMCLSHQCYGTHRQIGWQNCVYSCIVHRPCYIVSHDTYNVCFWIRQYHIVLPKRMFICL